MAMMLLNSLFALSVSLNGIEYQCLSGILLRESICFESLGLAFHLS